MNSLFGSMYQDLKATLQNQIARDSISEESVKEPISVCSLDLTDLPPPPPSPLPPTSDDISESIASLMMMVNASLDMRLEALRIFAEILLGYGEESQKLCVVEGLFLQQFPRILGEMIVSRIAQLRSQFLQSDEFFELHLSILLLSSVIQFSFGTGIRLNKAEQEQLFSPTLLRSLDQYIFDLNRKQHYHDESKQAAQMILVQLAAQSIEKVSSVVGNHIHHYLPPTCSVSPSASLHKIPRESSRSPPLSCAS